MKPAKAPNLQRADVPNVEREVGLRLFAATVFLVTLGTIAFATRSAPLSNWKALLVLAALLVAAEHRDRLFGDQTSASGSIVVAMAAVLAFSSGSWLAGPMLCSALAGAYWPHLRSRAWSRVAVNASSMSLAAATAATVFHLVATSGHEIGIRAIAGGVAAVLAFWTVNSLILGIAVAAIQGRRLLEVFRGLLVSETELLVFAFGGFLIGFVFLNAPLWIAALSLGLLLVVLDLFVMGSAGVPALREYGIPGIVALALVSALVWRGLDDARLTNLTFFALAGIVVTANLVGRGRREGFLWFSALSAVTAAPLSPGTRGSFFAPLAVGVLACLVPAWRRGTNWSRLSAIGAAGLAAVSATVVMQVFPAGLPASLPGSALAGAAAGLAALTGWHAALGLNLVAKIGTRGASAVMGVMRDEVGFVLAAGVCGAGSGFVGARWGVVGLVSSLGAVLGAAWVVIGRSRSVDEQGQIALGDNELTDVLRSALLDLPASRLPD